MAINTEDLSEWIKLHERAWRNEQYPQRPSESDLLLASVVAVWYPTKSTDHRFTLSVHDSLKDLNIYASQLLLESRFKPRQRLARLFVDGQRMKVRGVKIILEATR